MIFQHTVGLFRTVNMTPTEDKSQNTRTLLGTRLRSQRILLHDQRIYTEPDDKEFNDDIEGKIMEGRMGSSETA
jgi:hypothetical protein